MAAPLSAPLAVHEAGIERHYGRDPRTGAALPDPALDGLASAMRSARAAAEQLAGLKVALDADPTRTPAARALQVREAALRLGDQAAGALDAAAAKAADAVRRLEAETKPVPPREALAAEIRSRLASMQPADRAAVLEAALISGDRDVVGSVLGAPSFLAGLDPAQSETLTLRWRQRHHQDAAGQIARIRSALEAGERGGRAMLGFVQQLAEAPAARQAEAAAQAAGAALAGVQGGAE
jgi:hypothetical protein